MPPRPVILDTNFLLLPYRFKINIINELDYLIEVSHCFVISSRILDELKKLSRSLGKDGVAARLALKMVASPKSKIEVIETDVPVDDWIVDYAKDNNAIVCTNDAKLRKRLKGLKIVVLKSRSKLGFV